MIGTPAGSQRRFRLYFMPENNLPLDFQFFITVYSNRFQRDRRFQSFS